MRIKEKAKIIQVPRLKTMPFLVHGFGTRYLSEQFLAQDSKFAGFKKVYMDQKHSDIIHSVDRRSPELLEGDGLITTVPNILLVIRTADCLPALIVDTDQKVIAAVHCGWRGTGQRILQKTLRIMKEKHFCQSSALMAAMGPCICEKCYEVGKEVLDFFKVMKLPMNVFENHMKNENKYFLDLKKANQLQLQEIDVGTDRVLCVDECTYNSKRLLSFRRNGKNKERMLSFIGLFL